MPETVDDVRELGGDGRVEVGAVREHEGVDVRLDSPGELLEHEVLVLHLGDELGGLEQALAVPLQRGDLGRGGRQGGQVDPEPFVDEGEIARGQDGLLVGLDEAVVLRVEDGVDGGEADVFVAAPVARDEVTVEEFVVVGEVGPGLRIAGDRIADEGVGVGGHGLALHDGVGGMGDVVEEGVSRLDRADRADTLCRSLLEPGGGVLRVGLHQQLRIAVRPRDEAPVGVRHQDRHVVDVRINEFDAQHRLRLGLHLGPVRDGLAVQPAVEQVSGRERDRIGDAVARGHVDPDVLAQEDLVRGVGGVGLVLVDPRRRGVDRGANVVRRAEHAVGARSRDGRGAGQDHEALGLRQVVGGTEHAVAAGDQRIVGHQRNDDRAVAPLGDEIEPVVEELPEQGHPAVEGRRQADVGRLVRDKGDLGRGGDVVRRGRLAIVGRRIGGLGDGIGKPGRDRGRVVRAHVGDEVAGRPDAGVHHRAGGAVVVVGDDAAGG